MNSNKLGLTKAILFFLVFLRFVLSGWGMQPKPAEADNDKRFHLYNSFKYVKNYTPRVYELLSQNWCILQDQRGVIYAANQGGILEFDGSTWRTIEIPNEFVRSMDIAPDGTVYGIELLNANEQLQREDVEGLIVVNEATGEHTQLPLSKTN